MQQVEQKKPEQETAAASPPAVSVPPVQFDAAADASELYRAMKGGMFGAGTDKEAIYKTLEGKTPEQIEEIKKSYKEHYGSDLESDLQGELSGTDEERAMALLKGSQAAKDAAALRDAMVGAGTDEELINKILADKSPAEIEAIKQEYKNRYGESLDDSLRGELSGDSLEQSLALLEGNASKSSAAKLHEAIDGAGTTEESIYKELEGKTPEEIAAIKASYKGLYGEDLEQSIAGELSGPAKDRAEALLRGDAIGASAAALREAMDGTGTDEAAVERVFEGKDAGTREKITAAYNAKYHQDGSGSLESDLAGELSGDDKRRAEILQKDGELSDADKLYSAVTGLGTSEDEIDQILSGKSAEEIAAIEKEYKEKFGRDLKADLQGELGGRDEFDAMEKLEGAATTVEERLERLNKRHEFERSGVGSVIVDGLSSQGENFDERVKQVNELHKEAMRDGAIDDAERAELDKQLKFAEQDSKTYEEAKDTAADTAATVAATAAATAAVVATAGMAAPVIAGVAIAAGATGYVGAKAITQGSAYDVQGIGADAAIGGIEGAVTAASAGIGKVISKGIEKLATAGVDDAIIHAAERAAKLGGEAVIDGGFGGAAGDATAAAVNEKTWENGVISGLGQVAMSAATGAAAGMVGAGLMTGVGSTISGGLAASRVVTKSVDVAPPPPARIFTHEAVTPPAPRAIHSSPAASFGEAVGNKIRSAVDRVTNAFEGLRGRNLPQDPQSVIDRLKPGESVVIGRGSKDVSIDPNERQIGRFHAVITKLSDNSYLIEDGRGSFRGSFNRNISGDAEPLTTSFRRLTGGLVEVPGAPSRIIFPSTKFAQNINLTFEELRIFRALEQMQPGSVATLGKKGDIPFAYGDDIQLTIRKELDGSFEVADGLARSTNGTWLRESMYGGYHRVASQTVSGGETVKFSDNLLVRLGRSDHNPGLTGVSESATQYIIDNAKRGEGRFSSPDVNAPNGRYNGMPLVGRNMDVDGSIAVWSDKVITDFATDRSLRNFYREFVNENLRRPLTELQTVGALYDFLRKRMSYDHGIVEIPDLAVREIYGHATPGEKIIKLGDYIDRKAGVCRHFGLLATAMGQQLKKDGYIKGFFSYEANYMSLEAGHAWSRYTTPGLNPYIIDVAGRYLGPPEGAKQREFWEYRRNAELRRDGFDNS